MKNMHMNAYNALTIERGITLRARSTHSAAVAAVWSTQGTNMRIEGMVSEI